LNVAGGVEPVAPVQPTAVPSARTASPKLDPAEIATTLLRFAGIFVPLPLPQATTVPSVFNASENVPPPAIATTLLSPGGGRHWPETLFPQAATGPRVSIATELVIAPPRLVTTSW